MITVNLLGRDFCALLDSGSVCSFINRAAGERCRAHGYQPQGTDLPVRLANGNETPVLDWYDVPVKVGNTRTTQLFGVMPDLTVDILLGVDVIVHLGIHIPPPRRAQKTRRVGAIRAPSVRKNGSANSSR